jgi:hypothetical protein
MDANKNNDIILSKKPSLLLQWKETMNAIQLNCTKQFLWSLQDMKVNPVQYLSIPVSAAIIGYITNWLGVKMIFYPIQWRGLPIYKWPNQPLGILGWQGVYSINMQLFLCSSLNDGNDVSQE